MPPTEPVPTLDETAITWSAPPDERAGRPLLLALHGHRGDERQLAVASAMLPEVVIATPRAPYRLRSGGWSWFELSEAGIAQAARVVGQLLSWLDRQRGHSSLGVLGLSQGGAMAMALLRASPTTFDYGLQLSGFAIDTSPAPALAAVRPPFFSVATPSSRAIAPGTPQLGSARTRASPSACTRRSVTRSIRSRSSRRHRSSARRQRDERARSKIAENPRILTGTLPPRVLKHCHGDRPQPAMERSNDHVQSVRCSRAV